MRSWVASTLVAVALVTAACGPGWGGGGWSGGQGGSGWNGTTTSTGTWNASSTGTWNGQNSPPPIDPTPVVLAATAPPALSGGTLLMAKDGVTAVAADPDRDEVVWTDTTDSTHLVRYAHFAAGDEPGRIAQDASGLVHVALRRGGAVATINLATGAVVRKTPVCPAPRGVAYDASDDTVAVACVGGELVKLHASDDSIASTLALDADLRDVVPLGGGLLVVTRFRAAEVLLVDKNGTVRTRLRPPVSAGEPRVAWRAIPIPGKAGAIVLAHQVASNDVIDLSQPGNWSGQDTKPPLVQAALTVLQYNVSLPDVVPTTTTATMTGALPVDVAADATGRIDVTLYGSMTVKGYTFGSLGLAPASEAWSFRATSVAFASTGKLVGFLREPAAFALVNKQGMSMFTVGAPTVDDTGHNLFHFEARSGGLACASCHPEGREDGRVWQFTTGSRRTPSLLGGLLATAPFHWQGELADIPALTSEVYTNRMGGDAEDADHVQALSRFLDALPRIPIAAALPSARLDHGKALFNDPIVGCSGCHSGSRFTNNATVDVGLGGAFQVPTLVGVGLRDPYLSNGCAATLPDRFGPCGGGDKHGHTSQLGASDIADLVTYLKTL